MIYTVEIRGEKETQWKLLKDKVAEKYLSWDSTAFPDGEYRLRVTASDAPGNPPAEALTAADGERSLRDRQYASQDHGADRGSKRRQGCRFAGMRPTS